MVHGSTSIAPAVWALLALAVGCGPRQRFESVSGTVVFTDGRPVAGGVVEFDPVDASGRPARSAIGPDGRFSLKSGAVAGAMAGRYRVAVVQVLLDAGAAPRHGHTRVHQRFGRFETSGIIVEVAAGVPNEPQIVVEPLPSAPER